MAIKLVEKLRHDPNLTRAGSGIRRGVKGFPAGTGRYLAAKVPIAGWLPNYAPRWLINDVIAGISVGLIAVPQAIVFASLIGIPLQSALLSSWLPPLVYTIMGTSRDVTVGPSMTTQMLTTTVVKGITAVAPLVPVPFVTVVVAFAVGFWTLILGLLNLGFIFDILSQPVVDGFVMGISQVVILNQVPGILGLTVNAPMFMDLMPQILKNLSQVNGAAIGLGIASIVLMVVFKFIQKKWGARNEAIKIICTSRHIVVIGIATLVSYAVNKDLQQSIWKVTSQVKSGVPNPTMPNSVLLQNLLLPSIAIAFFISLEHISLAKVFANLNGYTFDSSQELVHLGVANLVNSYVGGAPVSGGDLTRAAINAESGIRSPLSQLITGAIVLGSMFQLGDLMKWIPDAAIAGVVLVSVVEASPPMGLLGVYWKISFADLVANFLSFNATLLASGQVGIGMGVAISTFYTLFRLMSTRASALNSTDLENQHNPGHSSWWSKGDTIPDGTAVVSVPRDVMYLNAKHIKRCIMDSIYTEFYGIPSSDAEKLARPWNFCREKHIARLRRKAGIFKAETQRLRIVIIDLTAVSFIDATGMQTLTNLKNETRQYGGINTEMRFVGMCAAVKKRFQRAGWGLTSPYEMGMEDNLEGDEATGVAVERDLVFDHLALAVQYQNRVSKVQDSLYEFDVKKI